VYRAQNCDGVGGLVRPLLPSTILFETHLMPDLGSFAIAVESRPGEGSTFQVYLPGVEARGHALAK
ncbi:unnamed protein product, partial [marine sediment metagenome]